MKVLLAHHDALFCAGIVATLEPLGEFEITRSSGDELIGGADIGADLVIADYQTAIALAGTRVRAERVLIICHVAGEARIREAFALGIRGLLLNGCSADDLVTALRKLSVGRAAIDATVAEHITESLNWEPLTAREQAVMRELLSGSPNKAIADRLYISVDTAKSHVKNILLKLGASNRVEAVAIAQRRGLLALCDGDSY